MDDAQANFEKSFGYESFVPMILFVMSLYVIYLILKSDYSQAFFIMLLSFLINIINNVYVNVNSTPTIFNEFLEDIASFSSNIIAIVLFGIIFYKGNLMFFAIIVFFAICSVLSLSRNWVSHQKNGKGFPIILNGLFFPLTYYIYSFYLGSPADSIFLIYFLIIGVLSVSKMNFIGYSEMIQEQIKTGSSLDGSDVGNESENITNLDSKNGIDDLSDSQVNKNSLKNSVENKINQNDINNLDFNNVNLQKKINNLKEQLYK